MKLQSKDGDDDVEMDMSPMIDMVFLLLIFFIVASQIVDPKPKVEIPEADAATIAEDITGRILVSVKEDERYFVGSTPVTLEQMKERIAAEVAYNPKLRVVIRCDEGTKYKINEKVMAACGEAGASDLIYAAFEE
jgi:biopolymer transport protein ExbD